MAEKLQKKNLLLIPAKVVKHVGLKPGDHVEVSDDGYHIIITPISEEYDEGEWAKISALSAAKGKSYTTLKGARGHLNRLKK